jgi:hypothetical protein
LKYRDKVRGVVVDSPSGRVARIILSWPSGRRAL